MTDDWQPNTSIATLRLRAQLLASIRHYFAEADVLEVDTPILSEYAALDPNLSSFATQYDGPGGATARSLYLQTSPELAMKRLLASGVGSIYQICKAFRNEECGRFHNPEFTLLEWYRVNMDYHQLMDEVDTITRRLLAPYRSLPPTRRLSFRDIFVKYCGLDPFTATTTALQRMAAEHIDINSLNNDRDACLDLLVSHVIAPQLAPDSVVFVFDYPSSQASLANIRQTPYPVAERFELFVGGLEIANGFQELNDATEQKKRFRQEQQARKDCGQPSYSLDQRFLSALAHGIGFCSGVALGIDRLLLLASATQHIQDILTFPIEKA